MVSTAKSAKSGAPFGLSQNQNKNRTIISSGFYFCRLRQFKRPFLFVASSAVDTDWAARLSDVDPNGRSFNIIEGAIRAAFQKRDWKHPELIELCRIYEYTINLHATSNLFKAGHCIRVQITSSNFPLWARNLNKGEPIQTAQQWQTAEQTIYHDAQHASNIVLPIVPREK